MMKKLLFVLAVSLMGTGTAMAQDAVISILGGSTAVDWSGDLDMTTEDGIVYTYQDLVISVPPEGGDPDPGVKFRKDHDWAVNWGGSAFPAGTATAGGSNIPATDGTYDVTFNIVTLQYNFTPADAEFAEVSMAFGDMDIMMATTDGVTYTSDNVTFGSDMSVSFMVDGTAWGNTGFPSGTAVEDVQIPVLANSYNISFNLDTKAYSFDFVTISLVGVGVFPEDETWSTDLDLTTTDGVTYTIANYVFPGGEAKFRLNHGWGTAWGGTDFPFGTGTTEGGAPNIPIAPGTWGVTFDRLTGAYEFTEPVIGGIAETSATKITVYPNPAQSQWYFTAADAITGISLTDVSGKVVFSGAFNAAGVTVDAGSLASGIYFAKVSAGAAVRVIKVVKD